MVVDDGEPLDEKVQNLVDELRTDVRRMENDDLAHLQTLENLTTSLDSFANWKADQKLSLDESSPAS